MTTISFFARGDSNTANNASLNVRGLNQVPVTQLTFSSGTDGDIKLDYNGGLPDPNTTLIINGVEMTFTVELTGYLPYSQQLSNVNGQNLGGKQVVIITAENGTRYFFMVDGSGDAVTMRLFPNGAHTLTGVTTSGGPILICFLRGTLILTNRGEQPVESLRPGDRIRNRAGRLVELRWVAQSHVSQADLRTHPELRPIPIAAGQFGPDAPHSTLWVSPQHRVSLRGWQVELLFGEPEVLVPAKHLGGPGVIPDHCSDGVDYFHLMFDRHEIVWSNGLPTESFQPGPQGEVAMSDEQLAEFRALFPALVTSRQDACLSLKAHEGRLLRNLLCAA